MLEGLFRGASHIGEATRFRRVSGSVVRGESTGPHLDLSSYRFLVRFVFICFVLSISATLLYPREAVAQGSVVGAPLLAQADAVQQWGCPEEPRETEHGGSLCASDWFAHIPIALASVAIVVGADGLALYFIFRSRRRREQAARGVMSP